MKRVITLILTVALVATLSLSAFAAGFISSPTGRNDVKVEHKAENKADAHITMTVTSYGNKDKLSATQLGQIKDAYAVIADGKLAEVIPSFSAIADENGVTVDNLVVSDLFDITPSETPTGSFELSVTAEDLHNFAALVCYVDGEWTVIEDAKVVDGKLVFNTDKYGTFAIVVKSEAAADDTQAPADQTPGSAQKPSDNNQNASQTGDYAKYVAYVAAVSAVVVALVVVIAKTRKTADEQ